MHRFVTFLLFSVILAFPTPALAQRFQVAGVEDDSSVFTFLTQLQAATAQSDSVGVAALMSYPFLLTDAGRKQTIRRPATVTGKYRQIFTPEIVALIQAQRPESLFVNWRGISIGAGRIWFGPACPPGSESCHNLRILTVNRGNPVAR